MPTPDHHGAPVVTDHPDPDRLPDWYLEDPDMWSGLSMPMGEYLALERLEGYDEDQS